MNFAQTKIISVESLQEVIERTISLSDDEKQGMQRASRNTWEHNDRFFKDTLTKIINTLK